MPWIYTLELSEKVDAQTLQDDWEADHPPTGDLGATVAGRDAVVASTPRAANFEDFAATEYVADISEYRELPAPAAAEWDPPYDAHPNGTITFSRVPDPE